jgi:hypothetical protein
MTYSGKFSTRTSSILTSTNTAITVNSLAANFNILESAISQGSSTSVNSISSMHVPANSIGMPNLCVLEKTQNTLQIACSLNYTNQAGPSSRIATSVGAEGINYQTTGMCLLNTGVTGVDLIKKSGDSSGNNTPVLNGFSSVVLTLKDI